MAEEVKKVVEEPKPIKKRRIKERKAPFGQMKAGKSVAVQSLSAGTSLKPTSLGGQLNLSRYVQAHLNMNVLNAHGLIIH